MLLSGKRKKDYCSSKNSKVYREDKGLNKIVHIKEYENVVNDFSTFFIKCLNENIINLNDYLRKYTVLVLNKERVVGNEQIILKLDDIKKSFNITYNCLNYESEFDSTRRFNLLYTGNITKTINNTIINSFFSIYVHLCRDNDGKFWIHQILMTIL